jgi:hypothetical protein
MSIIYGCTSKDKKEGHFAKKCRSVDIKVQVTSKSVQVILILKMYITGQKSRSNYQDQLISQFSLSSKAVHVVLITKLYIILTFKTVHMIRLS